MKKHFIAAIVSSVVLVAFAYFGLMILLKVFPSLAEQYFDSAFRMDSDNSVLYYLHPVVLSFMLAWFWDRFKAKLKGNAVLKGIEMGFIYGMIAIVPAMLINFSALNVSLPLILTWTAYGFTQAIIAGVIFGMMDP